MKEFNPKYKIVEFKPGQFKAYYKGWFFWHSFKEHNFFESRDKVFGSLRDTERMIAKDKERGKRDWERKAEERIFVPVVHRYPPKKLPGE